MLDYPDFEKRLSIGRAFLFCKDKVRKPSAYRDWNFKTVIFVADKAEDVKAKVCNYVYATALPSSKLRAFLDEISSTETIRSLFNEIEGITSEKSSILTSVRFIKDFS